MVAKMKRVAILLAAVGISALMSSATGAQSTVKRCPGLKAANGQCANMQTVDEARQTSMVMTTVRNSYFESPIGEAAGPFIPFVRLFRDDPLLFGLPTYTIPTTVYGIPNTQVLRRTK